MAYPIWKDKYINLGAGESVQYRILVGSSVIYSGKAYKRPGESSISVRINEVVADYLSNVLPTLSQAEFSALSLPLTFKVQAYASSAWTDKESVSFYNDWSYDYDFNPQTMGLAFPITGRVSARQWLIHTAYLANQETAVLTFKDGTTQSVVIPISRSNDFNDDFNLDFSRSTAAAGSGSSCFDLSQWQNLASVAISGTTYRVVDNCDRYAVHYVNAYGGWDSLLIEGNHLESDSLTRYTKEMEYDNRSAMNRGVRNYVNEIAKTITLHTGWLTDAESSRMHHLINSTEVYLEDINSGRFHPVTITATSLDYKTYKNQGARLVNYEFEVKFATNMVRR